MGDGELPAFSEREALMLLLLAAAVAIPLGLDLYLPVPEDNPLTASVQLAQSRLRSRMATGEPIVLECRTPETISARSRSRSGTLRGILRRSGSAASFMIAEGGRWRHKSCAGSSEADCSRQHKAHLAGLPNEWRAFTETTQTRHQGHTQLV